MNNNKMIAEFMGMKYSDERSFDNGEWTHTIKSLSKFQTDWNWLMPVVEKIECITTDNDDNSDNFFNVMIEVFECNINGGGITICKQGQTKLQGTYQAVVEFIKMLES